MREFSELWKPYFKPYNGHNDQLTGPISYAHAGEDLMLTSLFFFMGIEKPTWLDVGAHHPFNISNTALLYSHGCRGVNIEANPFLMPAFEEHRPEDTNVNVGIAPKNGCMKFFMWDTHSGRNTFSVEASKKMEQITTSVELPVITLNEAVTFYCRGGFPDLLLTDTEGLDYDILSTTDFSKSSPKVVCVEVSFEDNQKFIDLFNSLGYALVCRMSCDLIFIKNELKATCGIPGLPTSKAMQDYK